MKLLRRLALLLLILLVVVGVAYLALRDLPRRWLQGALSEGFQARVTVGALEIDWPRDFILRDVGIRNIASLPAVAEIRIDAIHIEGHWRELRRQHIERLTIEGLRGDLAPSPRTPAPFPTSELPFLIDHIQLNPSHLRLADQPIHFAGRWTGLGTPDLAGKFEFSSPRLSVAAVRTLFPPGAGTALGDLAGTIDGLAGRLDLARDPWAHFHTRIDGATLARGEHTVTLEETILEARLDHRDGRLTLVFDPHLSGIESAHLEATLDAAARLQDARATVQGVDLATWLPLLTTLPEGWDLAGSAAVEVSGTRDEPLAYRATFRLPRLTLPAPSLGPWTLREGEGEIVGTVDYDPTVEWTALDPLLESVRATLRAEVRWPSAIQDGPPPTLFPARATFDGVLTLPAASPQLSGRLDATLGALGRWSVSGQGDPSAGEARWRWDGADLATLRPTLEALLPELRESLAGTRIEGHATAHGRFNGPWALASTPGSLDRSGEGSHQIHGEIAHFEATLPTTVEGVEPLRLAADPWLAELTGAPGAWSLTVPTVPLTLHAPPLDPQRFTLSGTARIDGDDGGETWTVPLVTLDAAALGTVQGTGSWSPARGGAATVTVKAPALEPWLVALEPLLGRPTAGYELAGVTRLDLRLRFPPGTGWQGTGEGTVALTDAGFTSTDGSRVAQGLSAQGDIRLGAAEAPGTVELALRFGGFQLLWGTLFADFTDTRAQLLSTVRRDPDGAWIGDFAVRLPQGPLAEGHLAPDPATGGVRYRASVSIDDLATTLERYLQQPFQGSVFGIDALRLEGKAHLDLSGILATDSGSAVGQLRLEGLELAGQTAPVGVAGLALALPVDLAWRRTPEGLQIAGEEGRGSLRFERFTAAGLNLPATTTDLRVRGDTIALQEALDVPLLGGQLHLDQLTLAELLRPSRHLVTALDLDGVRLEAVSRAFDLPPLEGALGGTFPRVRITADRLQVEGGGELRAFGGTVALFAISGRNLLSRFPKITFSADLRDIQLLAVTQTFDVGELSGILEGSLRDCQLFQGVPVRCRGRLYSVPRKGVKQFLDVKAINNIAIIGTGNRITVFDRGIHKFFDRYRFAALGVEIQLVDDHFLLRGLEERGGRELFLKGKFPLRIDVVNAQPGHTVSFRTMLQRLENISIAPTPPPKKP